MIDDSADMIEAREARMRAKSDAQIAKEIAYAEGLIAGWQLAAGQVTAFSAGALKMMKPPSIIEWEHRLSILRDHRDNRRAEAAASREVR